MARSTTVVLFDIDGTLVRMTSGVAPRLFEEMIQSVFEKEVKLEDFSFSGKTDRGIIHEIAELLEMDVAEEHVSRAMSWVSKNVEHHIDERSLRLLTGVRELLDKLHARDDVKVGLLTGNLARCAEVKLKVHALNDYFTFGIYGEESRERNELAIKALNLLRSEGLAEDPQDVVIIGDTDRDVECARAMGARVIVTLTGKQTRTEIEATRPDHIFNDLSNTEEVLRAIFDKPEVL